MKKITLSLGIFMSLIFTTAQAQDEKEKTFSLGPMIGFSHTGITNVDGQESQFKPSFAAGLTATYSTIPHLGIGLDVFYSMEGAAFSNADSETKVDLHYLRIPLKFGYYFGDFEDRFRPKLTVGPSFGWLINSEVDYSNQEGSNRITGSYEGWDIGVNASAGFNYRLADDIWLNTDLGYYYGFIDVMGNDNFNTNYGLKVGLTFGL